MNDDNKREDAPIISSTKKKFENGKQRGVYSQLQRNLEVYNKVVEDVMSSPTFKSLQKTVEDVVSSPTFKSLQKTFADFSDFLSEIDFSFMKEIDIVEIKTESELSKFIEMLKTENGGRYYRGQESSEWDQVSSLLRGKLTFEESKKEYYVDDIFSEVRERFSCIFPNEKNLYNILSYLQHSGIPTMLLDYSKSPFVALSFALNKSSQDNKDNNLALYILELEKPTKVVRDLKTANSIIEEYKIRNIDLEDGAPMIVDLNVIDIPTNDRMKYQQAVFVISEFDYCSNNPDETICNERMEKILQAIRDRSIKYNFTITKYIIDSKHIETLCSLIENDYPQYTRENLLDPYKFLNEK